jgi:hypothetical protein
MERQEEGMLSWLLSSVTHGSLVLSSKDSFSSLYFSNSLELSPVNAGVLFKNYLSLNCSNRLGCSKKEKKVD